MPSKCTCAHTLMVGTGFEGYNIENFVLPSVLQGISVPVQFSYAATRRQNDASYCVLKYELGIWALPEVQNDASLC